MKHFLKKNKRLLTVLLALTGIAVTLAYVFCVASCSSLKGSVLGMDLKYLGIFYMTAVLLLAALKRTFLCMLLLAFGAGGEIFLITYQIRTGVYCPYCMAFAATILLSFIVNFEYARRGTAALAAGAGLVFFLMFFSGSVRPAYAADLPSTTFGRGPVEVRVYTDYFCGPCRAEEAEVMGLVTELTEKNLIHVVFIDTPVHQETVLYAGYFLAALNAKRNGDVRQAISVRAALFEAADKQIKGKEALEAFLKQKGVPFKTLDTAPVFKIFSGYINEDKVRSTPTCVIIGTMGKQILTGKEEIAKGLRSLRPEKQDKP